jgi:plastocyanin
MTMTQTIAFLRGALAVLVFAALTASAQAADVAVKISNFTFTPQQVTVKAGDTVTWTNEDDIPHTVTSKTMLFRSKALDSDDKFSFSFAKPGIYAYFCSLHPMMTGTIVVEAAAGK